MPLSDREVHAYSQSLPGLFHQLLTQLSTLLRQELSLARAELHDSLDGWLSSLGVIAGGLALLYAGFLLVLVAAVVGLALLVPLWMAALGIGVVISVIGFGLVQRGRRLLKDPQLKPTHFQESLRQDKAELLRKHPL